MVKKIQIFILIVLTSTVWISVNEAFSRSNRVYYIFLKDLEFQKQVLIKSIQGIINQKIKNGDDSLPMIYTILRDTDMNWLMDYRNNYSLISNIKHYSTMVEFAQDKIKNYVIWDPQRPWTLPIACSYAAQNEAMLFTPSLVTELSPQQKLMMDFTKSEWFFPDISTGTSSKIVSKREGYEWAIENILPRADSTAVVSIANTISDLRDYIFFKKTFAINLDPLNRQDEILLLNQILELLPSNIDVLGWPDASFLKQGQDGVSLEIAFVNLLSKKNDRLIAADYANNLSFHGLFKLPNSLKQNEKTGTYQKGKKYVCFIVSDGDNIQYDMNFMRNPLWTNYYRGKFPLGWTISPALSIYAPFVAWYYYNSSAQTHFNDTFVAGPSGRGYVKPSLMSTEGLIKFLYDTQDADKTMDISCITALDVLGNEKHTYQMYADYSGAKGVFLIEPKHSNQLPGNSYVFSGDNKKMGYFVETIREGKQTSSELEKQIRRYAFSMPFIMVYILAWDNNLTAVYHTYKSLRSDSLYEIVGPSEFMDCLIQYRSGASGINSGDSSIPIHFKLNQNYPNPFNPVTNIAYSLDKGDFVKLVIYNVSGEKIRELVNQFQERGNYSVQWDGRNQAGISVPSGIYFSILISGSQKGMRKMMVLR